MCLWWYWEVMQNPSDPFSFFEESLMGALVTEEVGKGVTGVQVSVCSI